jgi:hypothetical protein
VVHDKERPVSTSTLIKETTRKFEADPASATAMPAVTGTLVDGRALLSAGSFQWEADLGPAIGGGNLAPSPTAYLLGALAGCAKPAHAAMGRRKTASRAPAAQQKSSGARRTSWLCCAATTDGARRHQCRRRRLARSL